MFYLFKNLLAAKNENWEQIIIVVVIIIFGIVKAISTKVKEMIENSKESREEEPAPRQEKPKRTFSDAEEKFKTIEQLRQEKIRQIRATFGIPEPQEQKERQTFEPQYIEPAEPKRIERPIHQPKLKKPVMSQEAHTIKKTEKTKVHDVSSKPDKGIEKILFSSPDDLRKAVIYQEVLGKPLALRDN